jgi:hypothetical protein
MRRMGSLVSALAFAAPVFASPLARAQTQGMKRVEARVTAVSGLVVHLDQGGDARIEPGDRARATAPGGVSVELIVRAVSRQSARCELVGAEASLDVGTLVEVFVPENRAALEGPLPWSYSENGWSTDLPLLAPVQGVLPSQRDARLSGRYFLGFDWTRDDASVEQEYLFARTGLDLRLENATGRGDELRFGGQLFQRYASVDGHDEEDTTRGRIDRFSWRFEDSRERSQRFEVGRFLSSELPQLGVIDGVEFVQRTESGNRWGASVGLFPAWDATLSTGDDTQAAVFYRWFGGAENEFTAAGGFQKTWHEGEADRDVFVGDLSWRASERWRFSGAASVDWYTGDDDPKASGAELTELHVASMWTPKSGHGATLTYSHIAWPVLLRDELPPLTLETLQRGQLDRVSLGAWRDLTKRVRLNGRVDQWSSQDDNGGGGEVRVSWRDLLAENSELSAGAFTSDGQFLEVLGARLGWRKWSGYGAWFATFEIAEQDLGAQTALDVQAWRVGWDGVVGQHWDLSLQADLRTGDEQDALTLGFFLQRRF